MLVIAASMSASLGSRLLREQRRRGHQHAALAVAALRHLVLDPGLLQGMRLLRRAERLDRDDAPCRAPPSSGVTQERTALPSTCTVQAPQAATPQPNLVPVRPSRSRSAHSSGICGAASSSGRARDAPLTTISTPLLAAARRLCPYARIRPARRHAPRGAFSPAYIRPGRGFHACSDRSSRPPWPPLRPCAASTYRRRTSVLYGLIDASGSRSRPPGGEYRWQLDSGNMSRSFLGFRGSDDLGGGLRAVYRLESYFAHRHRQRPAATAAMPSGAATPTSASRARSAARCSAATSRRSS